MNTSISVLLIIFCEDIKNCWVNVELWACKCVSLHVHMYVYGWVCMYLNECRCMSMYTAMRVSVHKCEDVVPVYSCMCMSVCVHTYLYVYIWLCLCVSFHMYVWSLEYARLSTIAVPRMYRLLVKKKQFGQNQNCFLLLFLELITYYHTTLLYVEMHRKPFCIPKPCVFRLSWVRIKNYWEKNAVEWELYK